MMLIEKRKRMHEILIMVTQDELELIDAARHAYAQQTLAKPRTRAEFVRNGIAEMCAIVGFDFNCAGDNE